MIRGLLFIGLIISTALPPATADAGIVVNEVMYRPHHQLTIGRYEFIEIYNNGPDTVDLSGALLTDSQDFVAMCNHIQPADHEGVFEIPAGTTVAPGRFLTFWHAFLPGITDQPGNINYNEMMFFGNLVLNDNGDQVTVLRCISGMPVILDSLNYGQLGLGQGGSNRSIERRDPAGPTQSAANWGFTLVPPGPPMPNGAYSPGGTPGRINSLTGGLTCPIAISNQPLSASFQTALAAANASDCDGCSLEVAAYQFPCPAGATPVLDDAVAAIFGLQDFQYWPWVDDGTRTLAEMIAELAPYYDDLVGLLAAELGAPGEPVAIHLFRATYDVAPGASAWRWGFIVLFPASHKIAVFQKEVGEI